MEPFCRGTAIIEQNETGLRFSLNANLIRFEIIEAKYDSRCMLYLHRATINHEVLGELSWELHEYPHQPQNYKHTIVGTNNTIINNFEFGLEHVAFIDYSEDPFDEEIYNSLDWSKLTEDEKIRWMIIWFHHMFEEPSFQTPYTTEDGYKFHLGGPYICYEELNSKFTNFSSSTIINQAAHRIETMMAIDEWAPSDNHPDKIENLNRLFAEESELEHRFHKIQLNISKDQELKTGTDSEKQARQLVVTSAEKVSNLLKEELNKNSTSVHGTIGHDQPPDEHQISRTDVMKIDIHVSVIIAEAKNDNPDTQKILESGKSIQDWVKYFGKMILNEAIESSKKYAFRKIIELIPQLAHWLEILLNVFI